MEKPPKIFVSTVPFGEIDPKPIDLLRKTGWDFRINPLGRKLTSQEVGGFAEDADGLIAGTEDVGIVLEKARKLKIVARVGIGLDTVPLAKCGARGVTVTYTPDAVTMAAAEMTIGAMLSIIRFMPEADKNVRRGQWKRLIGTRLGTSVVGIIGMGRIGGNVIRLLREFNPVKILINDILDRTAIVRKYRLEYGLNVAQVEKDEIYNEADVISLHIPLTSKTKNLIDSRVLHRMKPGAFLLNYARGGIVNEDDLYRALDKNVIAGAAIDTFEKEPYTGPLTKLENVLLTQHMGSCSIDCRSGMEIEATMDMIRFFRGQSLKNPVPLWEYEKQ